MRVRRLFAALLLVVSAAGAHACAPRIVAQALPFEVQELRGFGVREITAINQSSGHALTRNGIGLGSTVTHYVVHGRLHTDARGCVSMNLEVGYRGIDLYVAKELEHDACSYAHVRTHELEHVAIARRWLAIAPRHVERRLAAAFDALMQKPAGQRLQAMLDTALAELKRVQSTHDHFDSPAEYRSNDTACGGHIKRVLERLQADGAI